MYSGQSWPGDTVWSMVVLDSTCSAYTWIMVFSIRHVMTGLLMSANMPRTDTFNVFHDDDDDDNQAESMYKLYNYTAHHTIIMITMFSDERGSYDHHQHWSLAHTELLPADVVT